MKHNATLQLLLVTIIILVVAGLGTMGLSWTYTNFGAVGSVGLFFAIFVPFLLFIQQFLTGQQQHQTMHNINEFQSFDQKVDSLRQQSMLEALRGTRSVMTIEAKSQAGQQKLLEERVSSLAAVMSQAEVAKVRGQVLGDFSENDSLD